MAVPMIIVISDKQTSDHALYTTLNQPSIAFLGLLFDQVLWWLFHDVQISRMKLKDIPGVTLFIVQGFQGFPRGVRTLDKISIIVYIFTSIFRNKKYIAPHT